MRETATAYDLDALCTVRPPRSNDKRHPYRYDANDRGRILSALRHGGFSPPEDKRGGIEASILSGIARDVQQALREVENIKTRQAAGSSIYKPSGWKASGGERMLRLARQLSKAISDYSDAYGPFDPVLLELYSARAAAMGSDDLQTAFQNLTEAEILADSLKLWALGVQDLLAPNDNTAEGDKLQALNALSPAARLTVRLGAWWEFSTGSEFRRLAAYSTDGEPHGAAFDFVGAVFAPFRVELQRADAETVDEPMRAAQEFIDAHGHVPPAGVNLRDPA